MKRQFDVFENPNLLSRGQVPCLAVLQSHHIEVLETVLVAPMMDPATVPANGAVAIEVGLEGRNYTLNAALMANIEARLLSRRLGSLAGHDLEILQAVNRLFVGF